MSLWHGVHWHEGMFLRPHHFQTERRWLETLMQAGLRSCMPFSWGVLELKHAADALENFTLRLEECLLRMKDGTWVQIPENALVEPLNFQAALDASPGGLEILLGVPQFDEVRANSISVTTPQAALSGNPRYEPVPFHARDENTGENKQRMLVRKYRLRLMTGRDDPTGYDLLRIGLVRRSDRAGAPPEFDPVQVGPHLSIQASPHLNRLFVGVLNAIEAKGDVLAGQAHEARMSLSVAAAGNIDLLWKLQMLNGLRARLRALEAAPALHPFTAYVELAQVAGELALCDETLLKPEALPRYDHDQPGVALQGLRDRIERLLAWLNPEHYFAAPFLAVQDASGREGLAVELRPSWIEEKLELYIGLESSEFETADQLLAHIYSTFDMKLASPKRSPRLDQMAVRGLNLKARTAPVGLPRRPGLHYYWIDRDMSAGPQNYWRECEAERGIWLSMRKGQRPEMERFRPTLYVLLRRG